jgi:lipopolysaccharide/colanic/teichoic acid biosynthesis glycosyltransferase
MTSVSKRCFDLFWAGLGLAVLWLPLLVIAALVKAQDGGPVFFRQLRVGHRGRLFRLWKYRTMVVDATDRGLELTVAPDARVTPIGAWLRRLKLDELPQLLNVLAGDMSLVGPRPEVPRYVALYSAAQRRVLDLVPGMTDEASLRYRDESALLAERPDPEHVYIYVIMPNKIRLSLAYAARATRWSDLLVILATLRQVFTRGSGLGVRGSGVGIAAPESLTPIPESLTPIPEPRGAASRST